jgi:hypothetical protein
MIWQLPPRVSSIPKKLLKNRPIFPWLSGQFLVEHHHRRLRLGADLAGAASQRVGRLQRVPPLHALAAAGAMRHRHVELPVDRPAGNLRLVLVFDPLVDELPAAAARTTRRQRRVVHLVDHPRNGAERLGPVVLAALAPGRLGIDLGQTARERGGLAFAGPIQ